MRTLFTSHILFFTLLFSCPSLAQDKVPKVVLSGIRCYHGVDKGTGQVLGDLVLEALLNRHGIRALGPNDITQMLKAEDRRRLISCDDESCLVELAGAMGTDWLIGGSVGKLDDIFVFNLMLIDSKKAKVTSRVSQTITKLKLAPALVGPMIDKLLGSKAKYNKTLPALERKNDSISKHEPWSLPEYKRHFMDYRDSLEKGPFDGKTLAQARKALFEDLVSTPMPQDFKYKRIVLFSYSGALESELHRQWRMSVTDKAVLDARRRLNEWYLFKRQMDKLEYAYKRGLKMEENGSGSRLSSLPFEVKPSVLAEPPQTATVKQYLVKWNEGQAVLKLALKEAKKKNFKAFRALWSEDAKGKKHTIRSRYDEIQKRFGQGFDYRTCRKSMLSSGEVERNSISLHRDGILSVCVIKIHDQYASSKNVSLKFEGRTWRIDSW